jgi:hypothetical protein
MRTTETRDENNSPVFLSHKANETKIYTIMTSIHFCGIKSKLYCNNVFIKDLGNRKIKTYSVELFRTLHQNAIKQFLTKYN